MRRNSETKKRVSRPLSSIIRPPLPLYVCLAVCSIHLSKPPLTQSLSPALTASLRYLLSPIMDRRPLSYLETSLSIFLSSSLSSAILFIYLFISILEINIPPERKASAITLAVFLIDCDHWSGLGGPSWNGWALAGPRPRVPLPEAKTTKRRCKRFQQENRIDSFSRRLRRGDERMWCEAFFMSSRFSFRFVFFIINFPPMFVNPDLAYQRRPDGQVISQGSVQRADVSITNDFPRR